MRDQLYEECRAMAQHALASGLKVPSALVAALEAATPQSDRGSELVDDERVAT